MKYFRLLIVLGMLTFVSSVAFAHNASFTRYFLDRASATAACDAYSTATRANAHYATSPFWYSNCFGDTNSKVVWDEAHGWIHYMWRFNTVATCPVYIPYQQPNGECTNVEPNPEEPTPEEKQGRSCSSSKPLPLVGDPIVVANGNSFQTETDYQSVKPAD